MTRNPLAIAIVTKYLPIAEKMLLAALTIAAVLMLAQIDTRMVIIALAGLSFIFFASPYRTSHIGENSKLNARRKTERKYVSQKVNIKSA